LESGGNTPFLISNIFTISTNPRMKTAVLWIPSYQHEFEPPPLTARIHTAHNATRTLIRICSPHSTWYMPRVIRSLVLNEKVVPIIIAVAPWMNLLDYLFLCSQTDLKQVAMLYVIIARRDVVSDRDLRSKHVQWSEHRRRLAAQFLFSWLLCTN